MILKSKKPSGSPQLSGEPLTQPLNTSTKANDVAFLGMKPLIQLHIGYIFFLDVRSHNLRRAPAKDDDWRLLSVHTQTGTAEGFAKVSCFENLLGSPTFVDIRNGRLRCVETGHEVVAGDEEAYARNKRCRLGLTDHALSHGKSPLTMFSQCLISHSKFVCKLIEDTVNKNEEHIWKYVTSVQSSLFLEAAFASNDMQHLAAMLRVLSELIPGFKETTEYYTF
uniref:Uncharacterized protein n=1 Tax=Brassica campestris TaxID=3711 RepID=M4F141_BRACM